MTGTLAGRTGDLAEIDLPLVDGAAPVRVRAVGGETIVGGQPAIVCLRPEDIELHVSPPAVSSGINRFEARVIDTVYLGSFLECRVRVGRHEVNIQVNHFVQLAPGQAVTLTFAPDHALCLAR